MTEPGLGQALTAADLFPPLLAVIPLIGGFFSLNIWWAIHGAFEQLRELEHWWYFVKDGRCDPKDRPDKTKGESVEYRQARLKAIEDLLLVHPPIQGYPHRTSDYWMPVSYIPPVFAFAWFVIFVITFSIYLIPWFQREINNWQTWALYLLAVSQFIWIGLFRWMRSSDRRTP